MNPELFKSILSKHKRVAIVGGPQTGKTTLSQYAVDRPVHANDDGKHIPWEDQPSYWMNRTAGQSAYVIEGVQAVRAVRKGLPVDAIIELDKPYGELSPGQQSMHKGQKAMLEDVKNLMPWVPIYK